MREMYQEAPESSWLDVKSTIESTLGDKIENIFLEIEKKPISSASIAQVHIARLKSGEKVAVKVQHKWLKEELPIDTKMTEAFVNLGNFLFKEFNYNWLLEDLKRNLPQELDFEIEARNSKKMKEIFKDNPQIKIPQVFDEFSNVKS